MDRHEPAGGGVPDSLSGLLDACPDAVVMVDTEGRIVHVNRQVGSLLGYSPDELVGALLEVLVPDDLQDRHAHHRARYQSSPTSRAMADGADLYARHRDGHQVPVDIALAPMTALAGRPVTAAFVRDAGERRRAEHHRRRLHDAEVARAHALEINDSILQGLAMIRYALELGDVDGAGDAVQRTSSAAQVLVEQLLGHSDDLSGGRGRFVRTRPALSEAREPAE